MSTAPPPELQAAIQALSTAGWHLRIEDSLSLGAFIVLVYDHMLTFSDEVEYIWKKKISPISILFLINRYFCPVAFLVCMVALFSPTLTIEVCSRFSKFEGVLTQVTVLVAEAILILRVYAIFRQNKYVLGGLSLLWVAQLCLMSFILANSGPVVIPRTSITYGCVLVANPNVIDIAILFVVPSLAFDTVTFVLLVWGILRSREVSRFHLAQTILRDGILYFMGVFVVNVAWTTTGLVLPTDLKNILAFVSTSATNILIGRLTLNLRMQGSPKYSINTNTGMRSWFPLSTAQRPGTAASNRSAISRELTLVDAHGDIEMKPVKWAHSGAQHD